MYSDIAKEPPFHLVSFVERYVRNLRNDAEIERRATPRDLLVVPVTAQPVNSQFQAIGQPLTIITRDISPAGAGLVHVEPIHDELLALQMQLGDEVVNMVSKVSWCKPLGPFYHIGVQFVAKLKRFPTWGGDSMEGLNEASGGNGQLTVGACVRDTTPLMSETTTS